MSFEYRPLPGRGVFRSWFSNLRLSWDRLEGLWGHGLLGLPAPDPGSIKNIRMSPHVGRDVWRRICQDSATLVFR